MQTRISAVIAFACSTLAALPARAELCSEVMQPASCHVIRPTADITFGDGGKVPALHDTSLFWDGDRVRIEAPAGEPGANVSDPGLEISFGAGGWGRGGEEPLVIARSSFSHLLGGQDVMWFVPLNSSIAEQWGEDCELGTSLCYENVGKKYIWTWHSSAEIYRRVRVTKTNPAPLPASVTLVPMLVDYRIGIYADGTLAPNPQGGHYPAVGGTATVTFGHFDSPTPPAGQYRSKHVHCVSRVAEGQQVIECRDQQSNLLAGVDGKAHSGTLSHQVPIANLGAMQLRIVAVSAPSVLPSCEDRETTYGTMCVVDPLVGAGHSVADPFVYIDPSWEYASWFEVEIAADETDSTWATPERRAPFDLETLMPIAGGDGGAGGGAGAGGDNGDGDGDNGDGDGNNGNGDGNSGDGDGDNGDGDGDNSPGGDTSTNGSDGSDNGCGCRVGPSAQSQSAAGWLLCLSAVAIAFRRRPAWSIKR